MNKKWINDWKNNWKNNWNQEKLRAFIAIGLTVVLLLILSISSFVRDEKTKSETEGQNIEQSEAVSSATTEGKITSSETEEETESNDISLSKEDQEFLDELVDYFEKGDLEGAARLMAGYDIPWSDFPCMYDGEKMTRNVTASKGLVFSKRSTVFYGEFSAGVPQGTCTALQVLSLEEGKRYDYAFGIWKDGKMSGEGECGYNYYDGVTSDIARLNSKKGIFQDDLMEGEVTYTSTNSDGDLTTWQFKVTNGKIIPDERWSKESTDSGEIVYRLAALEEEDHVYTLSESAMQEERWKNLIEFIHN